MPTSPYYRVVFVLGALFCFALSQGCEIAPLAPVEPLSLEKKQQILAKPTKLLLIFPAGAGTLRVAMHIAAQLEADLGLKKLGDIVDMAGGISGGALAAAALTHGSPPRYSARELVDKIPALVQHTFPKINELLKAFRIDYGLSLYEINVLSEELLPLQKLDKNQAITGILQAMTNIKNKAPKLLQKLGGMAGVLEIPFKYGAQFKAVLTFSSTKALEEFLLKVLGDSTLADKVNSKLIAIAACEERPILFIHEPLRAPTNFIQASSLTKLKTALIASSAIPGLIESEPIMCTMPDASVQEISNISDGVFISNLSNYDPSALLYEFYKNKFPNDDLLILYIGNGSKIDQEFRKRIGYRDGGQEIREKGRKITYMAIDAQFLDTLGRDLFSIAQIDSSLEAAQLAQEAAQKAINSFSYKRAFHALRALAQQNSSQR